MGFQNILLADSNIWDVIPNIKTIISLIAFIVAAAFLYFQKKTKDKRQILEQTPDDEKAQVAGMILEDFHVNIDELTKEQRYNLAMEKLKIRSKHRLTISILLAFLSVLALLALIFGNGNGKEKVETNNKVSYEVFATPFENSIEKRDRSGDFEHRNDYCQGDTPVNWIVRADTLNGWHIDVPSISITHTARSNCTFNGVFNESKLGFEIRGVVRNNGNCTPLSRDGRGKITASFNYTEVKNTRVPKPTIQLTKGKLNRNGSKEIELPLKTFDYKIIISDSENQKTTLSNINPSENGFSIRKLSETKLLLKT